MRRWVRANGLAVLVGVLFLASLGTIVATAARVFLLPHRELEARDRLRDAAAELAAAAEPLVAEVPTGVGPDRSLPDDYDRHLAAVTARVLDRYPGAEGGFYVNGGIDQFAGFAHPTEGSAKPGVGRREPPPLETPSIRRQAKEVLNGSADDPPLVEVRDVGPSRVAVATAAVGDRRPARLAAWVMVRLIDPAQQREELRGYLLSVAFALGGMVVALGLTAQLGRSLRHERRKQARLTEDLRKAEHLASLGRLLAGVAHEVRNPLAAIRSTVQLWERLPDQARTPASFAAVVAAVDRINGLVGRLLYFARSGHEDLRPVDLAAVTAETLELSRAQADSQGVAFDIDFAPEVLPVLGAPQALRQVVLNLVANALQAMPTGGRLVCRTRRAGDAVELTLSDTGPGIPPEVRKKLFEPFVTTRPDGTGLGLALCREIVAQQGGRIAFDPDPPVGATVRVTLPIPRAT
ncbi:two-component system sensor histidine kinase NtrB [Limnoglobus roseus]|uniref:histidine kinase n=1 Tax=Limnoglobus roseus TaxID=2598579 RepID=A0A5C1AK21_9BACT|nr:ATP-binding protein [Limnoglobus roseus]QEL17494.1 two-component sensor histidine kinase [Limnoglobus roseus]